MVITEEKPRCENTPRISNKLEEKIHSLTKAENPNSITVIIDIKDGKISREERRRSYEIISERHPNLFDYLKDNKIRYRYIPAMGQIIAEIKLDQFEGLSKVNHGEVISIDYNSNSIDDYVDL